LVGQRALTIGSQFQVKWCLCKISQLEHNSNKFLAEAKAFDRKDDRFDDMAAMLDVVCWKMLEDVRKRRDQKDA
jgi:hypothetical protein